MTAKKKTVIGYVLASLAIIAADQALKAWVVRNIPLNASAAQQRALIPGVVHLTHIRNSGVAFGMFSGGRWLFLALLAAFCVIVVWALVRHKLTAPWERWLAVLAMARRDRQRHRPRALRLRRRYVRAGVHAFCGVQHRRYRHQRLLHPLCAAHAAAQGAEKPKET